MLRWWLCCSSPFACLNCSIPARQDPPPEWVLELFPSVWIRDGEAGERETIATGEGYRAKNMSIVEMAFTFQGSSDTILDFLIFEILVRLLLFKL